MDKAELILYGVATYLAMKSLVTLMSEHRTNYKHKLAAELKASAAANPAAAASNQATPATKPPTGPKAAAKPPTAEAKPQVAGKT